MNIKQSIAIATIAGTAGLFSAVAIAQQQGQQPPEPSQSAPSRAAPADASPPGPAGMRGGREWRGPGMMGRGNMPGMSEADRTAFFEARLAAIRAGLMLTDAQQKLWPDVESAIRGMMKQRLEWRERIRKEGQPANPVDRMKRAGEMMSARGAAMTKMADAMKPFHDSLTDDQKRRMRMLMRMGQGGMRQGEGMGPGGTRGNRQGMNGEFHQRWHQYRGYGEQEQRGDDRRRQGMGRERQQGDRENFGEGRRWRQDAPGNGFAPRANQQDWHKM